MKPFFVQTTQIGVVVKDLDATLKTYVEKYGIGPWVVYTFSNDNVESLQVGGKPVDHTMKLALCNIGNTQWELIEPLDDKTCYAQFIKEHGEGIHHVAVGVDNIEEYYKFCAEKNIFPIQSGIFLGENGTKFIYDYRDTLEDLKVIVELHGPDDNFEMPAPQYVYPEGPMPRDPVFTDVLQVGIVCKDLKATIAAYTDKYGIGPWTEYLFDKDSVADMSIGGERTDYAMSLALAQIGNVQWELIEPLDSKSDYAKFLQNKGEGIHHVALGTKDYQEALKFCGEHQIKPVQYGYWGRNFHYDYKDTRDDLKCIVELYGPDPDFTWPEPLAVHAVG